MCFPKKFAESLGIIILKNICESLLVNPLQKEAPEQVLSSDFCDLFKNTYFVEDLCGLS